MAGNSDSLDMASTTQHPSRRSTSPQPASSSTPSDSANEAPHPEAPPHVLPSDAAHQPPVHSIITPVTPIQNGINVTHPSPRKQPRRQPCRQPHIDPQLSKLIFLSQIFEDINIGIQKANDGHGNMLLQYATDRLTFSVVQLVEDAQEKMLEERIENVAARAMELEDKKRKAARKPKGRPAQRRRTAPPPDEEEQTPSPGYTSHQSSLPPYARLNMDKSPMPPQSHSQPQPPSPPPLYIAPVHPVVKPPPAELVESLHEVLTVLPPQTDILAEPPVDPPPKPQANPLKTAFEASVDPPVDSQTDFLAETPFPPPSQPSTNLPDAASDPSADPLVNTQGDPSVGPLLIIQTKPSATQSGIDIEQSDELPCKPFEDQTANKVDNKTQDVTLNETTPVGLLEPSLGQKEKDFDGRCGRLPPMPPAPSRPLTADPTIQADVPIEMAHSGEQIVFKGGDAALNLSSEENEEVSQKEQGERASNCSASSSGNDGRKINTEPSCVERKGIPLSLGLPQSFPKSDGEDIMNIPHQVIKLVQPKDQSPSHFQSMATECRKKAFLLKSPCEDDDGFIGPQQERTDTET